MKHHTQIPCPYLTNLGTRKHCDKNNGGKCPYYENLSQCPIYIQKMQELEFLGEMGENTPNQKEMGILEKIRGMVR